MANREHGGWVTDEAWILLTEEERAELVAAGWTPTGQAPAWVTNPPRADKP